MKLHFNNFFFTFLIIFNFFFDEISKNTLTQKSFFLVLRQSLILDPFLPIVDIGVGCSFIVQFFENQESKTLREKILKYE